MYFIGIYLSYTTINPQLKELIFQVHLHNKLMIWVFQFEETVLEFARVELITMQLLINLFHSSSIVLAKKKSTQGKFSRAMNWKCFLLHLFQIVMNICHICKSEISAIIVMIINLFELIECHVSYHLFY